MRRVGLIFNIALGLALVGFTVEQVFAPSAWWLEVRKVFVPDFVVNDPSPLVAIDESIHRTFLASYYMDIRKVGMQAQQDGQKPDLTRFTYFCSGHGQLSFKPGQDPAGNVNVDWWTQNRCPRFSEGAYYAQLIITWPDFLVTRSVTIESNVWTVFPPPPPPDPPPPPQVIIQKPVTNVTQQVTQQVTRTIVQRPRCQPSLIPPVFCPPERRYFKRSGRPVDHVTFGPALMVKCTG